MKKIISLLLAVVLISGCDKQLNKSAPVTTDIQNDNQVNLSPSPSPSALSTPRPTTTPMPTLKTEEAVEGISLTKRAWNWSKDVITEHPYTTAVTALAVILAVAAYKVQFQPQPEPQPEPMIQRENDCIEDTLRFLTLVLSLAASLMVLVGAVENYFGLEV